MDLEDRKSETTLTFKVQVVKFSTSRVATHPTSTELRSLFPDSFVNRTGGETTKAAAASVIIREGRDREIGRTRGGKFGKGDNDDEGGGVVQTESATVRKEIGNRRYLFKHRGVNKCHSGRRKREKGEQQKFRVGLIFQKV